QHRRRRILPEILVVERQVADLDEAEPEPAFRELGEAFGEFTVERVAAQRADQDSNGFHGWVSPFRMVTGSTIVTAIEPARSHLNVRKAPSWNRLPTAPAAAVRPTK